MKTVTQLDDQGFFTGMTTADECPLEPGVYLYPAGTIDAPPPETISKGMRARFIRGVWSEEALPPTNSQPEVELSEEEKALKYLASTDWMVIRSIEGGKAVPVDVMEERAASRKAASEARE